MASAVEAARDRLRLITGTILHDVTDETFSAHQARLIAAYRDAWTATQEPPPVAVAASVLHGSPDQVTEAVLADPGLSAADELVLFLPPTFGLAENTRLLTDMAEHVAPALGWEPAT